MGLKYAELGCKRWAVIIAIREQDDSYRARAEFANELFAQASVVEARSG